MAPLAAVPTSPATSEVPFTTAPAVTLMVSKASVPFLWYLSERP
jgi:hypothetical protein